MMTWIPRSARMAFVIAIAALLNRPIALRQPAAAISRPVIRNPGTLVKQSEPSYMDKPLSLWLESIHNRDSEITRAFEAIRALGPEARAAVPELTHIIDEPFAPIRIGVDDPDVILVKLTDIQLRGDSVDALAAIGEAAAPSATTLVRWALTNRVARKAKISPVDQKHFIDLVALDVLERMRVAGAIAQFGAGASSVIATLLVSLDGEQRKFAVAIMSEGALPIASNLLKSESCVEREVGLAILVDMWPVVPRDHLLELRDVTCSQPEVRRDSIGDHARKLR